MFTSFSKLSLITLMAFSLNSFTQSTTSTPITQTKDGLTVEISFPSDAQSEKLRKVKITPTRVTITNNSDKNYLLSPKNVVTESLKNSNDRNVRLFARNHGALLRTSLLLPLTVSVASFFTPVIAGAIQNHQILDVGCAICCSSFLAAIVLPALLVAPAFFRDVVLTSFLQKQQLKEVLTLQPGKQASFDLFYGLMQSDTQFDLGITLINNNSINEKLTFDFVVPVY